MALLNRTSACGHPVTLCGGSRAGSTERGRVTAVSMHTAAHTAMMGEEDQAEVEASAERRVTSGSSASCGLGPATAYWGWLESWMLLRSYLAVETRQQAPCKKKTHRENAPELLVHL